MVHYMKRNLGRALLPGCICGTKQGSPSRKRISIGCLSLLSILLLMGSVNFESHNIYVLLVLRLTIDTHFSPEPERKRCFAKS